MAERRMRDDRVFPETRALGAAIVPFLLVAFALLYLFPDDTRHWFAWNVQPTITPLIMGAGYIAGAYFFWRAARETRWHRIHVGLLPVMAFTLFMAIGTFNHLDRFDTHHASAPWWLASAPGGKRRRDPCRRVMTVPRRAIERVFAANRRRRPLGRSGGRA